MKKPPSPVPITLGRFKNPKNSEDDWHRWREEQRQRDREADPSIGTHADMGRRLPIRYDE